MQGIRTRKPVVFAETYVVGRDTVYLLVTDVDAGSLRRYAVHKTELYGDKSTSVVARELPLSKARRLISDCNKAR